MTGPYPMDPLLAAIAVAAAVPPPSSSAAATANTHREDQLDEELFSNRLHRTDSPQPPASGLAGDPNPADRIAKIERALDMVGLSAGGEARVSIVRPGHPGVGPGDAAALAARAAAKRSADDRRAKSSVAAKIEGILMQSDDGSEGSENRDDSSLSADEGVARGDGDGGSGDDTDDSKGDPDYDPVEDGATRRRSARLARGLKDGLATLKKFTASGRVGGAAHILKLKDEDEETEEASEVTETDPVEDSDDTGDIGAPPSVPATVDEIPLRERMQNLRMRLNMTRLSQPTLNRGETAATTRANEAAPTKNGQKKKPLKTARATAATVAASAVNRQAKAVAVSPPGDKENIVVGSVVYDVGGGGGFTGVGDISRKLGRSRAPGSLGGSSAVAASELARKRGEPGTLAAAVTAASTEERLLELRRRREALAAARMRAQSAGGE